MNEKHYFFEYEQFALLPFLVYNTFMSSLLHRVSLWCVLGLLSSSASAAPQWIRQPTISPDGQTVAFLLRGQLRTVSVNGGVSVPLTAPNALSHSPVWSANSRHLALSNDQKGNDDVYIADLHNGELRQVTFSSANEAPTGFSPDGSTVLYASARLGDMVSSQATAFLSSQTQIYSAPTTEGKHRLVIPTQASQATYSPDGKQIVYAYTSSVDPQARQHRVRANAGELWIYDIATAKHIPLVRDSYDARDPIWSADGSIYYLSERSGRLNIWKRNKNGKDEQITYYKDAPVRGFSVSKDGTIAYTYEGQLYIKKLYLPPRQIEVKVPELVNNQAQQYSEQKTDELAVSPNGKLFALVNRGNIFLMNKDGETFQVTYTPEEERDVTWSPDGQSLLYSSARRDKNGILEWRIYKTIIPNNKALYTDTTSYKEELIDIGKGTAQKPQWSPDGTKIAFFYERREVRVLDTKTGKINAPYKKTDYHTSYSDDDLIYKWSPNSQYLLVPWKTIPFSVIQRWAITSVQEEKMGLVPITERVVNIGDVVWSPDGTQIIALTTRNAARNLSGEAYSYHPYRIFVSNEAKHDFLDKLEKFEEETQDDEEKETDEREQEQEEHANDKDLDEKDKKIIAEAKDVQNIQKEKAPKVKEYEFQKDRLDQLEEVLSSTDADSIFIKEDGLDAVLLKDLGSSLNVAVINLKNGELKFSRNIEGSFNTKNVVYHQKDDTLYLPDSDSITFIDTKQSSSDADYIHYKVRQKIMPIAARKAAFDQFWLDLKQTFYRADMQGINWEKIYQQYLPYLHDIASNRELAELFDEMGGALSASHLFPFGLESQYYISDTEESSTGALGIFIDESYQGKGIKIAGIIPKGPLDRGQIAVGDILLGINNQAVNDRASLDIALDSTIDKKVMLSIQKGEAISSVKVSPISLERERYLNRWRVINNRRALVNKLSNNNLAYTYIGSMNNNGFIHVYNDLLTTQDEKKGAIIDQRNNTGGDLYRQLMTLLNGKPYSIFGREDRPQGMDPTDLWRKKTALLVDTFSYSDGSVFPQAYKDARLGTIVGTEILNTGTGINNIDSRTIRGLSYSIPVMPMRRLDGTYYENSIIKPDIPVEHDPNLEQAGRDKVLEEAIKALLK